MSLSAQQIEEFQRNGVLALGQVLTGDELEEAQTRLRRLLDNGTFENLFGNDGSPISQKHWRLNHVWHHDEWYKAMLYHPRLLGVITSVLGPNVQLLHDQAFYKPAEDAAPTQWHNDNSYWNITPPHATSIWIALTDVTLDSSCLRFIPGSHLEPEPTEKAVINTGRIELYDFAIDQSRTVPFVMPAGHALMHHCQAIHGALANTSGRDRLAHAIHYLQSGVKRGSGHTFTDTDHHPVLSGELVAAA